jgi:ferredoxin
MSKRKIIEIEEDKCNGCAKCISNCHEGALQIIDGKARLISDLFCDGLGACIGYCPEGAMKVIQRKAKPYDEKKVMIKHIIPKGKNTIIAHLKHLKEHNATKYYVQALEVLKEKKIKINLEENIMKNNFSGGCPGAALREFKDKKQSKNNSTNQSSALKQWPVQLNLLPASAPFFDGSHLLIAADCVPFATANFHSKLLHGKIVAMGCPKFDNVKEYEEKLTDIFKENKIKSVTVAIMQVPCCNSLLSVVEQAVIKSKKKIPIITETVSINGDIL